jgi:GTP pyrophosphokinase/guanosine-3',5'-bis(diphosphate) 3'-pyrophosphohydrolase
MEDRTDAPDPARPTVPNSASDSLPSSTPLPAASARSDSPAARDDEGFEALLRRIFGYHRGADVTRLRQAYEMACEAHAGQKRYSGAPYITHPVAVASYLAELHLDVDTIITALLHDTVEDTRVRLTDIRRTFGAEVADLVDGVTKLAQVSMARGASKQGENLQKLVLAISRDVRVLLVKLADRLHNMHTLGFVPNPEKRERTARETLEIFAPLARRIGVQRWCGELEDQAFRWINPAAFESVSRRLAATREARASSVAEVSGAIADMLARAGLEARVYGREKRPYSIWAKLERRGLDFDDLADIYAFRVIVAEPDDCYRALGLIHRRWRCVPERFKDFISTSKPNNYRSIHTTIIGPDHRRVELQIRTEEMDRVAEDGVAAHWRYKNTSYGYDAEAAAAAGGDPLERLRSLVDILEHGGDPDEFLEHAKLEMFADQVFAFTPKGEVIALPGGATPLDFAYAVHTQIGDTCVGAKINGRQRPLRTRIQNGDVVEIIRSGTPAPLPGWEDIAVTGRARSAIRRLIRKSEHGEFARIGRAIAEHGLRREGVELAATHLADALKRLELDSEDELFADIGRGRLTSLNLLNALFPGRVSEVDPRLRELIVDEKARLFVRGRGLTPGVSLHFASCCSPLPGDRIVGILHRDRGVDVHIIDCERLEAFENEQERWLDLGWTAEAAERSVSTGRIMATVENTQGALAEITGVVSRSKGNIVGVRVLRRATDYFEMSFDVEVVDARHLAQIVAAMRACASVVAARRDRGQAFDARPASMPRP